MSERVRVVHDDDGRLAAVKGPPLHDPGRVRREAEVLREVQHPGVVVALGLRPSPTAEDELWTRWIGSRSTADLARPLAPARAAGLALAVGRTLGDLHRVGVVHGNLEPAHVVLDPHGRPVLCGFGGSARLGDPLPPDELGVAQAELARPAVDVAGLGRLLTEWLEAPVGAGQEGRPVSRRRDTRRHATQRRALLALAGHATRPDPLDRPALAALLDAIREAVPDARLAPDVPPPAGDAVHVAGLATTPAGDPPPRRTPAAAPHDDEDPEGAPALDPSARRGGRRVPDPLVALLHTTDGPLGVTTSTAGTATGLTGHTPPDRPGDEHPAPRLGAGGTRPPGRSAPHEDPTTTSTANATRVDYDDDHEDRDEHVAFWAEAERARWRRPGTIGRDDVDPRAVLAQVARLRPGPTDDRPARRWLGPGVAAVGLAVAAVAGASFLGTTPSPSPPPTSATPPAPASGAPATPAATAPQTPGTGAGPDAAEATVVVDGPVVEHEGRRYQVGQAGDLTAVGDWRCDGRVLLALYRPTTGSVFVFDAWPRPGERSEATAVASRPGATALTPVAGASGCPALQLVGATGPLVTLGPGELA